MHLTDPLLLLILPLLVNHTKRSKSNHYDEEKRNPDINPSLILFNLVNNLIWSCIREVKRYLHLPHFKHKIKVSDQDHHV